MRIKRGTILRLIIGILLLALIIYYSRPEELLGVLSNAAWEWLLIAIGIHLVATGATALRIAYLLERLDIYWPIFKANLGGMILADTTPGRAGYFATPLIVGRECPDVRKGRVLNVMFFGQIFDFLLRGVLLGLAILTVFYAIGATANLYLYGFLSLALVIALTVGFAILAFNKIPKPLMKVVTRIRFIDRLYTQYSKYAESAGYSPKKAGVAFFITIVGWLLTATRWMVVGHALGLMIPLEWYLFIFPALTAVSFIPVSLAGLGIVEGGFALVFFVLGRPTQNGVAFALVDRAVALTGDLFGLPYVSKVGEGLSDLSKIGEDEDSQSGQDSAETKDG
ncbi:MAG: YbhN family protein [Candidatus Sifarchaeia archaeon]